MFRSICNFSQRSFQRKKKFSYRNETTSATSNESNIGKIWSRGFEMQTKTKELIKIQGTGATKFLQGLTTNDVSKFSLAESSVAQSNCFLDKKGRVLSDTLLYKISSEEYILELNKQRVDSVYDHLKGFILRRTAVKLLKISSEDEELKNGIIFGTLNASSPPDNPDFIVDLDPRLDQLGVHVLSKKPLEDLLDTNNFPHTPGTYELIRRLGGIAEGEEIMNKLPLECNLDLLKSINFRKGCYLGQELTARTMFKGVVRKRILPLLLTDVAFQLPPPWQMASIIQRQLALGLAYADSDDEAMPPLPQLTIPQAGALLATLCSSLPSETLEFFHNEATPGRKIVDKSDDKPIAEIVSPPIPGTSLVLAMVRLDRVGILKNEQNNKTLNLPNGDTTNEAQDSEEQVEDYVGWKRTNKVYFEGLEDQELRYLPYLPSWWTSIDRETGKDQTIAKE